MNISILRSGVLLGSILICISCRSLSSRDKLEFRGKYERVTGDVTIRGVFNQNSLLGIEVSDEVLIALTTSGHLLKFDLNSIQLIDQRICVPPYRCLSRDPQGNIVAAADDGRLDRINPRDLSATMIARLPGIPMWIGPDTSGGGMIATVGRWVDISGWPNLHPHQIWDVRVGKGHENPTILNQLPSTYFVDNDRNVWLGGDHGEWGGMCARLNLHTGEFKEIEFRDSPFSNIYGFFQLKNETMLAYGGMMHFSATSDISKVINGSKLEKVYAFPPHGKEQADLPPTPYLPITQILHDPRSSKLIVFAYDQVYTVDPALTNWKHESAIAVNYTPGRPDAMGVYPAIVDVVPVYAAGRLRLIAATTANGIVEIEGAKVVRHAVRHSLAHYSYTKMRGATDEGAVFSDMQFNGTYRNYLLDPDLNVRELSDQPYWPRELFVPEDMKPDGRAVSFTRDRSGRIWAGGEGLWLFDAETRTWRSLSEADISKARSIHSIAAFGEDGIVAKLSNGEFLAVSVRRTGQSTSAYP